MVPLVLYLSMNSVLNKLVQYYQIFCNLSLDVAAGVLFNLLALQHSLNFNAPLAWYIVLPMGTWLIYLTDHIVDVLRATRNFPTPRHLFIKTHLYPIIVLAVLLAIICLCTALYFYDERLVICGFIMSGVIMLHLVIARINPQSRSILNNKEFGVAFIYATSIFIYPLSMFLQSYLLDAICYLYLLFLLITYQNLLLCSLIEFPVDVQMNNTSFIRSIGLSRGKLVFIGISISTALLFAYAVVSLPFFPRAVAAFYFLILSGNVVIYLRYEQLKKHLLYRKLAEALFWLPALSLLL